MSKYYRGTYTALITPFAADNTVDEDALKKLIDLQIDAGVEGIVVVGTTGESPTLRKSEHIDLIEFAVKYVQGRTQVIAGAGSNSTREAVLLSQKCEEYGADSLLHITPYYNKPTQKGIYEHFLEVSKSVSIPILLYNISARTGVNIETDTLLSLAEIPNIVGVKEASGDLAQVKEVIDKTPNDFSVVSGNDDQTLEILQMGGDGAVSVLSNIFPQETKRIIDAHFSGDTEKANEINRTYADLVEHLFIETNPIPVKTLLAEIGLCKEIFRLPLTTMNEQNKSKLLESYARVIQ